MYKRLSNLSLLYRLVIKEIVLFNIEPTHLVITEIAHYIKQHKDIIKSELLAHAQDVLKLPQLTELTPQQKRWLNQIANILKVTPDYLLQHKLIDQFDLVELLDKDPAIVANTTKSGYYWINKKLP